jgi:endonuclease-3 related protein
MPAPEIETSAILNKTSVLQEIYQRLYQRYGPQHWWPGEGPLDVIIGAILTQSAAWPNVERALFNLKEAGCWSLEAIHRCPRDDLAAIIHPCGYFNTKARKLKAFAEHIVKQYGGHLEVFLSQDCRPLREELLSIYGIGLETADDILVYAAEQPSFVIDTYTVRILQRVGLAPAGKKSDYHAYQGLFHIALPQDVALFNEYHALLDQHAKQACNKTPKCRGCCLRDMCRTGQQVSEHASPWIGG